MSDRLAVMRDGKIVQIGAPHEVYEEPADAYVADFLGVSNLLEVDVVERGPGGACQAQLGDSCWHVDTAGRTAPGPVARGDPARAGRDRGFGSDGPEPGAGHGRAAGLPGLGHPGVSCGWPPGRTCRRWCRTTAAGGLSQGTPVHAFLAPRRAARAGRRRRGRRAGRRPPHRHRRSGRPAALGPWHSGPPARARAAGRSASQLNPSWPATNRMVISNAPDPGRPPGHPARSGSSSPSSRLDRQVANPIGSTSRNSPGLLAGQHDRADLLAPALVRLPPDAADLGVPGRLRPEVQPELPGAARRPGRPRAGSSWPRSPRAAAAAVGSCSIRRWPTAYQMSS